ncbi:hypothetical protein, partial [Streptomyces sp. NPDC019224]|uniref:hypothetical protein n=1 Tax=Streptomyces sp. NPDC019224 TaxID=3154484 RepID=UPI0033E20508
IGLAVGAGAGFLISGRHKNQLCGRPRTPPSGVRDRRLPPSLSKPCAESHPLLTGPPFARQTVDGDINGMEQSGRSMTDPDTVTVPGCAQAGSGGSNGP